MKTIETLEPLHGATRAVFGLCAAFLAFAACPASAQTTDPYRPGIPQYDQAGVDVSTGRFGYRMPLFQSPPGSGWLDLTFQYTLGSGWSSDYSGSLDLQVDPTGSRPWSAKMSFGNSSDYHHHVGGSPGGGGSSNRSGSGWIKFYNAAGVEMIFPETWVYPSQFVPAYVIWTNNRGTEVKYVASRTAPPLTTCPECYGGGVYHLDTVREPDGTVLKYHYKEYPAGAPWNFSHYRLQSITTNRGFQLKYEYQSNNYADYSGIYRKAFLLSKITQINNGVEYCSPTADHCNLSQAWPFISSTSSNSYSDPTSYNSSTFTDPSGGVFQFQSSVTPDTGTVQFRSPRASGFDVTYNVEKVGSYSYNGWLVTTNYSKRVTSATINGNTWTYSYVNHWASSDVMNFDMTSTDPFDNVRVYESRGASNLPQTGGPNVTRVTDELNHPRLYSWSRDRPTVIVNPEGDRYTTTYDDRGNITALRHISKSGAETLAQTFSFPLSTSQAAYSGLPNRLTVCDHPMTCNRPTYMEDARLGRTDWTYTAFGEIASEMKPAPTAGAARPLVLNTYSQKYEYVRNSAGALVPAASPVWLLSSTTQCQTVAGSSTPACDPAAPQVVTTFEYGPNGTANSLLVRGQVVSDGTTALRTCYGYDAWGRRISESRPGSGLVSCA